MPKRKAIEDSLSLIFQGIAHLKKTFKGRAFTIDGRLVGDIGEVIAALEYDVTLYEKSQPDHDGLTSDGRRVQVKVTFQDMLTFKTVPEYYLGFKLYPDGRHDEVFNGPGTVIRDRYSHRKGVGTQLLRFPIEELKRLSRNVLPHERIPKREG